MRKLEKAFEKALTIPPNKYQAEGLDDEHSLTEDELAIAIEPPDFEKFVLMCDALGIKEATKNYSLFAHCGFVVRYVKHGEAKTWPELTRIAINRHLEKSAT
jgi:hypothetical protein